jgi:hypothetical protein
LKTYRKGIYIYSKTAWCGDVERTFSKGFNQELVIVVVPNRRAKKINVCLEKEPSFTENEQCG